MFDISKPLFYKYFIVASITSIPSRCIRECPITSGDFTVGFIMYLLRSTAVKSDSDDSLELKAPERMAEGAAEWGVSQDLMQSAALSNAFHPETGIITVDWILLCCNF